MIDLVKLIDKDFAIESTEVEKGIFCIELFELKNGSPLKQSVLKCNLYFEEVLFENEMLDSYIKKSNGKNVKIEYKLDSHFTSNQHQKCKAILLFEKLINFIREIMLGVNLYFSVDSKKATLRYFERKLKAKALFQFESKKGELLTSFCLS